MADFFSVVLYESIGGRSIDLTGQHKNLKWREVENYGLTGTVEIVNDFAPASKNLLSPSCTKWSSGSGAIRPGMFLRISGGSGDVAICIITDMSPSEEIIKLTFGDCIQLLRATGAEYRRNHYSEAQQHNDEDTYGGWDAAAGKLYVTKPADIAIKAETGDVRWAINKNLDTPQTQSSSHNNWYEHTDGWGKFTFGLDLDWLHAFTVTLKHELHCRLRVYVSNVLVHSQRLDGGTSGDVRTITLPSPTYVRNKAITVMFDNLNSSVSYHRVLYADVALVEGFNATWEYYLRCLESYPSSAQTFDSGTTQNVMFKSTFIGSAYSLAISGEQSQDPTKYYITAIDSASADQTQATPAYFGRARLTYTVLSGGLPMHTVYNRVCEAAGYTANVVSTDRAVGVFRCGGADYHSYLLALADMDEPSGSYMGRQHAMIASRSSWAGINLGYRRKATDSPSLTLYYAGDGNPGGGVPMMSFSPSMTMRYRPNLAVTKGTKDNGTPIVLAVKDPQVALGSSVSIVSGSVTGTADAALSSYSQIATNRSGNWEGKVKLSGIHTGLMTSGTYTGGVAVRIYDSRYGMSAYPARVREVEYDVHEQTTTITLNNYDEIYSNAIVDSSKMAYSAGSMSVEATSNDLFTLQYVCLDTTAYLGGGSSHTVEILSGGSWYSVQADVVRIPDLGIAVLSGYFPRGTATTSQQYGVTHVRVDGGTTLTINSNKRPDKYTNQSLIVNVQMRI